LHYGLDGSMAHMFIFIICTTHVPQTFVVSIKLDEFIVSSSVHFIFVLHEKSTAGFIKTRYAKLRNNFPSTAIVKRLSATRLPLALRWFIQGEQTV
jgi:hypothetical protein